jgi:hypothetical protein
MLNIRMSSAWRQPKQIPNERATLDYRVSYLDPGFRKGRIEAAGASIHGTLEFFVRVPPLAQAMILRPPWLAYRQTPAVEHALQWLHRAAQMSYP